MATSKASTAKKTTSTAKPAVKKTSATASKPAAAKAAAKPAAPKTAPKPVAEKKPAPRATTAKSATPSPEQRYKMVQDAAYFIAEKNGFVAGSLDYWIAAEAEIDALLSGNRK